MSFKINDQVMHCRDGLSTIVSSTKIGEIEYFLIRANVPNSSTIYVPVLKADIIIRKVMNEKEADNLLKEGKKISKEFNPNTKQRRDSFKKKLNSGKVEDMLYLFMQRILYTQFPEDVKLGPVDLDMLNYANNFLMTEFSISYNIDRDKIEDFVIKKLKEL